MHYLAENTKAAVPLEEQPNAHGRYPPAPGQTLVLYDGGTAVGGTSFFHCLKQKTHSVPPPACRTFFVVLVNNVRAQRRSAREGQNSLPASGLASASSAALLLCLPPATQCPQHFFYLPPFLSENDFSALFWRKHIVIFAIPNRMQ